MTHAPAGADPAVVGPYLATALADDRWRSCTVELIAGGKSNLTYRLDSPAGSAVLRRPPLGHVLPTAHDMVREHTVMSALAGTDVPVPRMLHLCTDAEVLGHDAPMHKYAIQITVADVRDGALSSSTLKEASSWGKVDTVYEQMVFSEATLAVPLIVGYAYHRGAHKARTAKRWAALLEQPQAAGVA